MSDRSHSLLVFRAEPRPRKKRSVSPRKMPVQARAVETVTCLLDATARVLVKEGYDRASTNRIALAAGVSVGSLYQYFPSKEALVTALVVRHRDEMLLLIGEKMLEGVHLPLEVGARKLVSAMIEAHRMDPKLHRVLIEQVPRIGGREALYEVESRMAAMVATHLAARAGDIRKIRVDLATFVLVRAVESLSHGAVLDHPELLSDDALIDEITLLIVRYLAP